MVNIHSFSPPIPRLEKGKTIGMNVVEFSFKHHSMIVYFFFVDPCCPIVEFHLV
jgi:hypothetical protein